VSLLLLLLLLLCWPCCVLQLFEQEKGMVSYWDRFGLINSAPEVGRSAGGTAAAVAMSVLASSFGGQDCYKWILSPLKVNFTLDNVA
jgi:hypothetical protein